MHYLGAYLAALALLAAAPAAGAGSPGKRPLQCPHARPVTLVADSQASVYRTMGKIVSGCEVSGSASIEGRVGRRRAVVLGAAPFGTTGLVGGVDLVALSGTVAAYETYFEEFAPISVSRRVVVRDLRTGRVLHSASVESPEPAEANVQTTAIVVKADGAVAWIVETPKSAAEFQLHALDSSGSRLVASGSDIAPGSLALAGNTLYWTQGARAMSTTLN